MPRQISTTLKFDIAILNNVRANSILVRKHIGKIHNVHFILCRELKRDRTDSQSVSQT